MNPYKQAALIFLIACSSASADYYSYRDAAMKLFKSHKYKEAMPAFLLLTKEDISDVKKADALEHAALCALRMKQFKKAMERAKQIPLEPWSKTAQMEVLAAQRQWSTIIKQFKDEPIIKWPHNSAYRAFIWRGKAYIATRKQDLALADLKQSLTYEKLAKHQRCEVMLQVASLIQSHLKDSEKALAVYKKIIKLQKNSISWVTYTCKLSASAILRKKGSYDEALKVLAIERLTNNLWGARIIAARGEVFLAKGDKVNGIEKLEKALSFKNVPKSDINKWQKLLQEAKQKD